MFFVANLTHGLWTKASAGTVARAAIEWGSHNYDISICK
jgi:hypothetical protein